MVNHVKFRLTKIIECESGSEFGDSDSISDSHLVFILNLIFKLRLRPVCVVIVGINVDNYMVGRFVWDLLWNALNM